jgi:hypothetical protein
MNLPSLEMAMWRGPVPGFAIAGSAALRVPFAALNL